MDTRLGANATSARVSIHHNAENVHSQIHKQQGSRLRCKYITIEQQKVNMHFACGYTCPGIYFQNPKDSYLSVRAILTINMKT
jgi:hypothetical protein